MARTVCIVTNLLSDCASYINELVDYFFAHLQTIKMQHLSNVKIEC